MPLGAWIGVCLTLTALLPTGCATVRRARAVQRGEDTPPGERTVRAVEAGLTRDSLLTLDEALRIALTYHPSLAQATQALAVARAQLQETKAGRQPSLNAAAGYRRGTSSTEGQPAANDAGNVYSGSLGLDLLLYDFGKTPAQVRQACAHLIAAAEGLRAARSDVAYGVRTAFFDLARAQELRQVAEDAVRQYQAHLEQVKAYAEVGRRIRYDVTKAEVDLGNAQLNQISAANAVATARAALNRSLGLAEEPGYRLGASEDLPLAGDADALMAAARERHPALRALRAQETFASAAVDETIADLYPSLRLTGQYGASGSRFPLIGSWWGAAQSAWSAFTGWRKTGRVDETAAQLRTARAATASREQQIHLEIRSALSQLDSARQRRQLSDLIVREAQESLNLVSERYRVGQASAVDVTDAQVALTQAQGDRVRARFDCQTAVAQLKHAIGEE